MDPIDPAFLERTFDRLQPGFPRVERVRPTRDEQPAEQWDQEHEQRHEHDDEDEDVYEPSTPAPPLDEVESEDVYEPATPTAQPGVDGEQLADQQAPQVNRRQAQPTDRRRSDPEDAESVVVELDHHDQALAGPPDDEPDHPHIDITV